MYRAFFTALLLAAAIPAPAQDKALVILVGASAGSAADAVARAVAGKVQVAIRMKVTVENKPGAGGREAAEALRAAPADGMTVMIAPETLICIYPAEGQEIGYNPFRDFIPVTQAARSPFVLAVGGKAPAKKVAEFLKSARENPGMAEFGSIATGSTPQLFGLALGDGAGVKLKHIPYENAATLQADLVSGKLAAAVDTLADLAAPHRAGKVRILAVSGAKRSALLPAVPTFAEEGLKDPDGEGWYAFFAPWNTPKTTVERLAGAMRLALGTAEVREAIAKLGLEATGTQSWDLRASSRSEYARWAPAARAAGFTPLDMPNLVIH